MVPVFFILLILVCLSLIVVILFQSGKGGGMGAAFGSGMSGSVFGGKGAGDFLTKVTIGLSIVFAIIVMQSISFSKIPDFPVKRAKSEKKPHKSLLAEHSLLSLLSEDGM
jgi:preprotein translocase subunit SecG